MWLFKLIARILQKTMNDITKIEKLKNSIFANTHHRAYLHLNRKIA